MTAKGNALAITIQQRKHLCIICVSMMQWDDNIICVSTRQWDDNIIYVSTRQWDDNIICVST